MFISSDLLSEIAPALRNNQLNLLEYIDRICKRLDEYECKIQSLVPEANRNARLKEEAKILLRKFPDTNHRPLLFGVLIGVKDVIKVEGFPTQAGSQLPPELFAGKEASCVRKFRTNGAIILGKTVTTEFTLGKPGPTRNPYNLDHTPGGSSSGSAAAVAAGFCPLAMGTQTGGSVIRPAAFCGIIGFKPTYGRINTDGVIHYSKSIDHMGLFTQDVPGMILAASIVCDRWKKIEFDFRTNSIPVVGIPEGPYLEFLPAETQVAFKKQVAKLEVAGYRVKKIPIFKNIEEILNNRKKLAMGELAEIHKKWFIKYKNLYSDYTIQRIMIGKQVSTEDLIMARSELLLLRKKIDKLMMENNIDIWIAPSALGPAPKGLTSTGDSKMNQPWTYSGHPVITLPAGFSDKEQLPLGVQVIARYMNDEKLLSWAVAIADILQ